MTTALIGGNTIRRSIEQSVPARFLHQVEQNPDDLALQDDRLAFTYAELNQASNVLAHKIFTTCAAGPQAIAFLLPHGALQVVAMLGILKTGNFYLPLDPNAPAARLSAMLEDAEASLLLMSDETARLSEEISQGHPPLLHMDTLDLAAPAQQPDLEIPPDALALLHYTSGSTGRPKAVKQTHRNINHFMITIGRTWPLNRDDRFAHFVSCAFSAHVMTIFGSLLNGAALFPFDARAHLPQLPTWLVENKISVFFAVPSAFRAFCNLIPSGMTFPDLRLVGCAGETVYNSDLELFKNHMPAGCDFRNLLASTEAYYLATMTFSHADKITDTVLPVGWPVPDKEIFLLDEEGQRVPNGEPGEIIVRSTYLSPGYWKQSSAPNLSADPDEPDTMALATGDIGRFRSDGALIHIGRKDFQVKIRGQRVELGEIETHLLAHPDVKDAAVAVYPDRNENPILSAYILPKSTSGLDIDSLRDMLKRSLPDFMIPAYFTVMEVFPQTPTGKVDRNALPAPSWKRPETRTPYVAPRTEIESQLAEICENTLGFSPVGVHDNFYELGLDSLKHLNLFSEIEKTFSQRLSMELLLQSPTIEKLALLLQPEGKPDPVGPVQTDAVHPAHDDVEDDDDEQVLSGHKLPATTKADDTVRRIVQRLPYPAASRLINILCGLSWFQKRYLPEHTALVRAFLLATNRPASKENVRNCLANGFLLSWRITALGNMTKEDFLRQVEVSGTENLQNAKKDGTGTLVINSHFNLGHMLLLQLARMDAGNIKSLGTGNKRLSLMGLNRSKKVSSLEVRTGMGGALSINLYKAKLALDQGELVHLAADGYQGKSGLPVSLFGRERILRVGFAELALNAEVPVVPAFVTLKPDGRVRMEFLPALETDFGYLDHKQQVRALVDQYAAILQNKWAEAGENVTWLHMQNFLALPTSSN